MDAWGHLAAELNRIDELNRTRADSVARAKAQQLLEEARWRWATRSLFTELRETATRRAEGLSQHARGALAVDAGTRPMPDSVTSVVSEPGSVELHWLAFTLTSAPDVGVPAAARSVQLYSQRAFAAPPLLHLSMHVRERGARHPRVVSFPGARVELDATGTARLALLTPHAPGLVDPLDALVYRAFELLIGGARERSPASSARLTG